MDEQHKKNIDRSIIRDRNIELIVEHFDKQTDTDDSTPKEKRILKNQTGGKNENTLDKNITLYSSYEDNKNDNKNSINNTLINNAIIISDDKGEDVFIKPSNEEIIKSKLKEYENSRAHNEDKILYLENMKKDYQEAGNKEGLEFVLNKLNEKYNKRKHREKVINKIKEILEKRKFQ